MNIKKKIWIIRFSALFFILLAGIGMAGAAPFFAPFPIFIAAGLATWANNLYEKDRASTEVS